MANLYTKTGLQSWSKERLIEEVIKLKKANNGIAKRLIKAGDYIDKANELLVLH